MSKTFDFRAAAALLTVSLDSAQRHLVAGNVEGAVYDLDEASRTQVRPLTGEMGVNSGFRERAESLRATAASCCAWFAKDMGPNATATAVSVLETTLQENRVEPAAGSALFGRAR